MQASFTSKPALSPLATPGNFLGQYMKMAQQTMQPTQQFTQPTQQYTQPAQQASQQLPPLQSSPHALHRLPVTKNGENPKTLAYSAMAAKKRLKDRKYESLFEAFLFGMSLRYQNENTFWSVFRLTDAKISIVTIISCVFIS